MLNLYAGVAELADAPDLGSGVPYVQVQVLSPAPKNGFAQVGIAVFYMRGLEPSHFYCPKITTKLFSKE